MDKWLGGWMVKILKTGNSVDVEMEGDSEIRLGAQTGA